MQQLRISIPFLFILLFIIVPSSANANRSYDEFIIEKVVKLPNADPQKMKFVYDPSLYNERWDTLPQPKFWQDVIRLSPDSAIVNIASTRTQLQKLSIDEWNKQNQEEKQCYKNNLCALNYLEEGTNIYVTTGKNHFYDFKKVLPHISKAIDVFVDNNTDPWYAQAILLIESPNNHKGKSSVGAVGPFQLMKDIGKKYGLVVNKYTDERTDLKKSAGAASKYIKNICIPYVKAALAPYDLQYSETDIWFRILVLHAYHAGAGNVSGVIHTINPSMTGIDLIKIVWQTEYRGFKNQSQNYSQIALASIMTVDRWIGRNMDTIDLTIDDHEYSSITPVKPTNVEAMANLFQQMMQSKRMWMNGNMKYLEYSTKSKEIREELRESINIFRFSALNNLDEWIESIGDPLDRKNLS